MSSSHSSRHKKSTIHNAPVAILYDIESCPVPNTQAINNNIRRALKAHGIHGRVVQQNVFGDHRRFSERTFDGLNFIFQWLAGDVIESILVEMFFFTLDYPPPACIMLISGDDIFADALHRLSMRGYTVILAVPSTVSVSSPLTHAGRFVWDWPSLSQTSTSFTANATVSETISDPQNTSDGSVAVLWDMESCPVPGDISVEDIAGRIRTALQVHPQVKASVTRISAYGHSERFSHPIRNELRRANVECSYVPNGVNPFITMLVDVLCFAVDNPRPACFMVISGDANFCHVLNRLRNFGYTVLLAIPDGVSSALRRTGTFRWDWPSLSQLAENDESDDEITCPVM